MTGTVPRRAARIASLCAVAASGAFYGAQLTTPGWTTTVLSSLLMGAAVGLAGYAAE